MQTIHRQSIKTLHHVFSPHHCEKILMTPLQLLEMRTRHRQAQQFRGYSRRQISRSNSLQSRPLPMAHRHPKDENFDDSREPTVFHCVR
ncbi:unnamed protein product [Caenorhabditis brenneri]